MFDDQYILCTETNLQFRIYWSEPFLKYYELFILTLSAPINMKSTALSILSARPTLRL